MTMRGDIDPCSTNDVWARLWSLQAGWTIDPVNGNDRDSGSASAPLKSWAEFTRRVQTVRVAMTVSILGSLAEPIVGQVVAADGAASLQINFTPTVLATAAGTTFTDPVRTGAQAMGTMSAGNIADWTAHLGKMLRSSDGRFAPIIGLNGAPLLPYWASEAFSNAKPANGLAVDVLQLATVPSIRLAAVGMPVTVRYVRTTSAAFTDVSFVKSDSPQGGTFVCCEFGGFLAGQGTSVFIGCLLRGSGYLYPYAPSTFIGGGSLGRAVLLGFGPSTISFQGFIVNGNGAIPSGIVLGNAGNSSAPQGAVSGGGTFGVGVFNCTGNAIEMGQGATASFQSLFGAGNGGYGLNIGNGARAWCSTTPSITGALGDLRFCGAATAIPPLVAGAAVPAAAPLTSWATEWAAPPFSKQVMHYGNGTVLAGA